MRKKPHSEKVKLSDSDEWADIFTDGASEPQNPGHGGWAYVVLIHKQEVHRESGSFLLTTNNRMELIAVIKGIQYAIENHGVGFIKIHSDSKYVVNGISWWVERWNRENYEGRLNSDLWKQIFDIKQQVDVRAFFVKGHNGDQYNELCDELAYEASVEQKNSEEDTFYMRARETMTKEEMMHSVNAPQTGPSIYREPLYFVHKKGFDKGMDLFLNLPNT